MNDLIRLSIFLKAHNIEHAFLYGIIELKEKELSKLKAMLTSNYLKSKFKIIDSKHHSQITFYTL